MDNFRKPTIEHHGIFARHDQACAVFHDERCAVYDCNTGTFQPSWMAQRRGWHLVHADTWLKRAALKLFFDGSRFRYSALAHAEQEKQE